MNRYSGRVRLKRRVVIPGADEPRRTPVADRTDLRFQPRP